MAGGKVWDVIVVGGGHNGLVCAAYLARAGLSTLVLERREMIGGAAVTEEIHPGFRCPTVAHGAGPLLPEVARDLELAKHGLVPLAAPIRLLALAPSGPPLCLYDDVARSAAAIAERSAKDGKSYTEFQECFARLGNVLRPLFSMTPPAIGRPPLGEALNLLRVGRRFRGLPQADRFRLLRFGPMPVSDLMEEFFSDELLQAAIGARGIFGAFAGPYAAGTSLPLLLQAAMAGQTTAPSQMFRGGMGALTEALRKSAETSGAEIRTAAAVLRIVVKDGAARGVVLASGEELSARAVASGCDPKRTYLGLLDPTELDPSFLGKVRNYRCLGMAAKVNLALSALPTFSGLPGDAGPLLSGRVHIGPTLEHLERAYDAAKYGEPSERPYLDLTIPSLLDPDLCPKGAHVLSVYAQYAPRNLRQGDWHARREELGDIVLRSLEEYAPNIKGLVVHRQVLTPLDLEERYGLTGGHPLHGEQTIDQFFSFRPLLGHARYRGPLPGLYLCGAGAHPGGGLTGAPGWNASREIRKDLR